MDIAIRALDEIKPYEKNPRNNKDAVKYVANSIKEFGFKVPIVIDSEGVIVAGHTRYKAAKKLKLDEVPCIVADDLTEDQIRAFRIADNKVSEIAEWDFELLEGEMEMLDFDMADFGFLEEDDEEPQEVPAKDREDLSGKIGETYEVIIECENELQQEELYYRLTEEGLTCRTLIL